MTTAVNNNLSNFVRTHETDIVKKDGTTTKSFQSVTQLLTPRDNAPYRAKLDGTQRFAMDLTDPNKDYTISIGGQDISAKLRDFIPDEDRNNTNIKVRLVVDTYKKEDGGYAVKQFKVDWTTNEKNGRYKRFKSGPVDSNGAVSQTSNDPKEKAFKGFVSKDNNAWSGNYLNQYRVRPEVAKARVADLVENQDFSMNYQPIVDASKAPEEQRPDKPNPSQPTGQDWKTYDEQSKSFAIEKVKPAVVGAEALLPRVQTKREEAHYFPDEIVAVADKDPELVKKLGERTIEASIAQAAKWEAMLGSEQEFTMNINLSPKLIEAHKNLVSFIEEQLNTHGVTPSRVQFELTEDPKFDPTDANIQIMNDIRALGCKVALDDIGSTFQNGTPKADIKNADRFPVDTIKIDRNLLWTFHDLRGKNPEGKEQVKADKSTTYKCFVKQTANTLQNFGYGSDKPYELVAEGVEDVRGVQLIKDLGIKYIQGWVYAEKETPAKFESHYLPIETPSNDGKDEIQITRS